MFLFVSILLTSDAVNQKISFHYRLLSLLLLVISLFRFVLFISLTVPSPSVFLACRLLRSGNINSRVGITCSVSIHIHTI